MDRKILVGDIKDWVAILMDNMPDACSINAVLWSSYSAGATTIYAIFTHGIFSGPAVSRINNDASEAVDAQTTFPKRAK